MSRADEAPTAIYATQRPHLQPAFTGKLPQIRAQHAAFWAHAAAAPDVLAYQRADPSHAYAAGPPKWLGASTRFTRWAGPVLAESPTALLIGNWASFDAAQYAVGGRREPERAGMSMVHLLVIPRAGLFNGAALDGGSVGVVDEMAALFRGAWARREVREAVVGHQLEAVERRQREAPDDEAYEAALRHWAELRRVVDEGELREEDFRFGLHLWPDHSVGHLHMHVIAAPFAFRKYSTSCHDEKTKDAFEVRDYIQSLGSEDAE